MAAKPAERLPEDTFEREVGADDLARIDAAIDRSDAQIERGETVPFAVLVDDVQRILNGA